VALSLLKEPYLISSVSLEDVGFKVPIDLIQSVDKAMKLGPKTLFGVLREVCRKKVVSTATLLHVSSESKVRIPSNLESAADSLAHRMLILFDKLKVEMEISEEQISVPTFSQGWTTNMSYIFDLLSRIVSNLGRVDADKEKLPAKMNNSIGNVIVSLITFKWANKHSLSTYLKNEVKRIGNIPESNFLDLVKSWGTACEGNLAGCMASSLYQVIGYISNHPGIEAMMNKSMFLTGSDVRKLASPPRQLVEKVGRQSKIITRGELNVLRFDGIRFLLPRERLAVRIYNESGEIENQVRQFDALEVQNRNYSGLLNEIKGLVTKTSDRYFKLRRLARQRLYAVKEVRREAKQQDQITDAEFANNEFIDTVCEQAESMIIDLGRRRSVTDRLRTDIVSLVFEEDPSLNNEDNDHP
jgi:hypothetical protein